MLNLNPKENRNPKENVGFTEGFHPTSVQTTGSAWFLLQVTPVWIIFNGLESHGSASEDGGFCRPTLALPLL